MYAAIRAKAGDHLVNTLSPSRDRFEVFMTPEQAKGLGLKPGTFVLWNLDKHHLEHHHLNQKGWILL
jgi:hypothetical protein